LEKEECVLCFSAPLQLVLEECEAAARALPGWGVDRVDVGGGELQAFARGWLGRGRVAELRVRVEVEDGAGAGRGGRPGGGVAGGLVRVIASAGGPRAARELLRWRSAVEEGVANRLSRRESGV
jgi:hypothetical protein